MRNYRRPPRTESFAGVKPPDYSSLLRKARQKSKQELLLIAVKEAYVILRAKNKGYCIASIIDALEKCDPEWLRRYGWGSK